MIVVVIVVLAAAVVVTVIVAAVVVADMPVLIPPHFVLATAQLQLACTELGPPDADLEASQSYSGVSLELWVQ